MYYGGILYDDNLKLTKVNTNGDEIWTRNLDNTENIIPADLTISSETIYYGCHTGREGAGDPFDYTCISLDTEANINWIKHYANPRGYSLEHIRNELYGIKANESSIYMFGGTGDESNYSAVTHHMNHQMYGMDGYFKPILMVTLFKVMCSVMTMLILQLSMGI